MKANGESKFCVDNLIITLILATANIYGKAYHMPEMILGTSQLILTKTIKLLLVL
jgi:hypothetical protein